MTIMISRHGSPNNRFQMTTPLVAAEPERYKETMKRTIAVLALIMLACGCAHAPGAGQIHEKVYEHDDVDDFIVRLKEQHGIRDVNVDKSLFLTTSPPKVLVSYSQNGQKNTLLIAVEPDKKLKLVKPE